jgi:hypothetical protein
MIGMEPLSLETASSSDTYCVIDRAHICKWCMVDHILCRILIKDRSTDILRFEFTAEYTLR